MRTRRVQNRKERPADDDARERLLAGAPVTRRQLSLSGASTALLEAGEGPPLVLLHGQGGFAGLWLSAIPGLATTHHVIAPDLPGLGASQAADGPPGTDAVLGWLGELVDKTCPQPPVLVGFSLGGQVAARFAATGGTRLAGLVLVDTPGLVGRVRPAPSTLLALIRHQVRPSRRSALRLLERLTVDLERLRHRMGEGWEPFLAYLVDRSRTPSIALANRRLLREIGLQQIPPADIARIRTSTTLIWGRDDRVAPLRTAVAASSPYGWPLHVIDDAGHLSPVEQPQAFLHAFRLALQGPAPGEMTRS
jgi:pimeloyl-ACP methyl ester carboxylesterase